MYVLRKMLQQSERIHHLGKHFKTHTHTNTQDFS